MRFFLSPEKFDKAVDILAVVICLFFTVAGVLVSLHRFWQYETQYYDFGIFDTAIRSVSRFQPPIIDHFVIEDKLIWADHFHPAIFLLSPLYWITQQSEVLLIAQMVSVGLSAYVLYRIGVFKLNDRFLSLAVLISYTLFVGLQNAIITDFHEITVMTLPLMLCYWAIITERKKAFIFFFVLTLAFKELLFSLGLGLALFVFLYQPKWKKLAGLAALYSILWGVVTMKFIIPHFAGGSYQYAPKFSTLGEFFQQFISPIIKLKTTFQIFWSFLFLPLLYLPTLPIILMNLGTRFLSGSTNHWDLGFHYNAEIAPTLAVSTILAFALLQKKTSRLVMIGIGVLLILNSVVLYRFILRGPFGLAYNPAFYAHTKNFTYLNELITKVPPQKTVMTQNNLAVRFTDRKVKLLRENYEVYKPEIIVLDLRDGQNPNNFMGVKDVKTILTRLQSDQNYNLLYHQGDQYIFERI
jgi:uncharacterized membrane protein